MSSKFKIAYVTFLLSMLSINAAVVSEKHIKEPKVVGGVPIAISRVPHQVSVRLKNLDKDEYGAGHICGGSVISQRVVLTAADCVVDSSQERVRNASEFTLVMGTDSLYKKDENTLQYDVQQVISHKQFDVYVNDIALLFINGYIPWNSPNVKAIALAKAAVATNTPCVVTGWGETDEHYISPVLLAGSVPIASYAECYAAYGLLYAGTICAGLMQSDGAGACVGDIGTPLQCNNFLAGLYAYGRGCGLAGFPGVYTDVFKFNGWIESNNASLNYSDYGGDASNISGQSRVFMLLVALMTLVLGGRI